MRAIAADRNLDGDWTDNHGSDGVNVLFGTVNARFVRDAEAGAIGVIANSYLETDDSDIYSARDAQENAFGHPMNAWIGYESFLWNEDGIVTFGPGFHTWTRNDGLLNSHPFRAASISQLFL